MPTAVKARTRVASNANANATIGASTETKTVTATSTASQTDITVQQSLQLVQTMIHSSISCIAYLRDLFPDRCFTTQTKEELLRCDSFESYLNRISNREEGTPSTNGPNKGYASLIRGKKDVADQFLRTLQQALVALEKTYLKSLQLTICDVKDSSHVLEAYTFTFGYRYLAGGGKVFNNMAMDDSRNNKIMPSLNIVRHSLGGCIRRIAEFCGTFPALPEERGINLRVIYTDDCPKNYHTPGFDNRNPNKYMMLGEHENWRTSTQNKLGILDTGYRGVGLKISHLESLGSIDNETIPADLYFSKRVLAQDEIDDSIERRLSEMEMARAAKKSSSATLQVEASPGRRKRTDSRAERASTTEQGEPMIVDELAPVETATQMSTQTREDHAMRSRLNEKMGPSPLAIDAGETQIVRSPIHPVLTPSHASSVGKIILSDHKLEELKHSSVTVQLDSEEEHISCQCGHNEADEEKIILCEFCHQWQHLACYGYEGPEDGRIPDTHACYECLLGEKERPLLKTLSDLAIDRKAVRAILEHGYFNPTVLAKQIHRQVSVARIVEGRLAREGFLIRLTASAGVASSKRKTANSKPAIRLAENDAERPRLMRKYFNPTMLIAHHLQVPSVTQPPNTGLSTQYTMPPTETPFTAPRIGNAQTTSEIDLDVSETMDYVNAIGESPVTSPVTTPTKPMQRRSSLRAKPVGVSSKSTGKRKASEDVDPETPAAKKHHLRSEMTRTMIATRTPMSFE